MQSARAAAVGQHASDLDRTVFSQRIQLIRSRCRLRREQHSRRAAELDAQRRRAAAKTAAYRAARRLAQVRRHLVQARRRQAAAEREAQKHCRSAGFAQRRAAQLLRALEEHQRGVSAQLADELAAARLHTASAEGQTAAAREEARSHRQALLTVRQQLFDVRMQLAGHEREAQRAAAVVNARAQPRWPTVSSAGAGGVAMRAAAG